jgi:hypothetical protein
VKKNEREHKKSNLFVFEINKKEESSIHVFPKTNSFIMAAKDNAERINGKSRRKDIEKVKGKT